MNEFIIGLIVIFIALSLAVFFVKSLIKFVIFLGIIYLLFNIGFLWNSEDFSNLPLGGVLKNGYDNVAQNTYDGLVKKREETGIIDSENIKNTIDTTIENALENAKDEISNIDKQKLIDELNSKLANYDQETITEALYGLKSELEKYNVSEQELKDMINQDKVAE
ncbi:MAG: hypothetical protein K0R54_662 [Clostridiaceae bacterium]|nr:hypothetical protein [Clostridiaceae bacterium]